MNRTAIADGFRQISRHDGLFRERAHDKYKSNGTLAEPAVCTRCHAVYGKGCWQWHYVPVNAHDACCPACHRIRDNFPAGFLILVGYFYHTHREEVLQLVCSHERHEQLEHPLKRIISAEQQRGATLVTTTDLHLARDIGELLHHTYQGRLKFHYHPEKYLLRVQWKR